MGCELNLCVCTDTTSGGDMDAIVFDLDGTLYPHTNGYEAHVRSKIFEYMRLRLGVELGREEETWKPLFERHNQSLKGLREGGYQVNVEEYWEFIRKDDGRKLVPDERVQLSLSSMPCRKKVLLTNCNEKQAWEALCTLQLDRFFDEENVFGATFMGDHCKPEPIVFERMLERIEARPERCILIEDSLKNLKQGKNMGMTTVYVTGPDAKLTDSIKKELETHADAVVSECIYEELKQTIPSIFEASCHQ